MPRRTHLTDADHVETAEDLEDVVTDKREGWRQASANARRRQRRYKKKLTSEITKRIQTGDWDAFEND